MLLVRVSAKLLIFDKSRRNLCFPSRLGFATLHLSALAVVASAASVLFNSGSAAMTNDCEPSDRAARIARAGSVQSRNAAFTKRNGSRSQMSAPGRLQLIGGNINRHLHSHGCRLATAMDACGRIRKNLQKLAQK